MTVNKFQRLDKHTARTTARIVNYPTVRLYHFSNQLYHAGRSIKLTIFLSTRSGVHLQKILIYSADKVFFLKTLLTYLINIVDKVFYLRLVSTKRGKEV